MSRDLSSLCLAGLALVATPAIAGKPASWMVCDTTAFVETLWPKYAAAHAAAVAALRNDVPPGAWRSHRYLVGHSQIRRATLAHLGRGAARDLPFGTRTPGEA